jgi:hypothetical protein
LATSKAARIDALERQIDRIDRRLERLQAANTRFSWARLLSFLIGFGGAVAVYFFWGAWPFAAAAVGALALFMGVVIFHRRLEKAMLALTTWRQFKQEQVARARLDWSRMPPATIREPRYDHPFEADLDLVGDYSLHRLLDTAASSTGSERLRAWLSTPVPDGDAIRARQRLVAELRPRSLFRTKLAVYARMADDDEETKAKAREKGKEAWQPDGLLHWLDAHETGNATRGKLLILALLAAINLGGVALYLLGMIPPIWPYTLPLYVAVYFWLARNNGEVFHEASDLQSALRQLAQVSRLLERYPYHGAPGLAELCAPFRDPEQRPSRLLARIGRVIAATGIQGNPFFWVALNVTVPWDYFFAVQLNRLKAELAGYAPRWLDVWFELEALSGLANLGYLNPHYAFPAFTEEGAEPVFQAEALGHPLLPDQEKVCNDFTFHHLGEIGLITGSNMAGKSTFLRTAGVNLALAYAGAPVDAARLETRLFRLFTCIKVSDSVTGGISYFYAEVKRLKALLAALDADHELPLFFAIDEIFRGTNNRERLQGSRAYVRALTGKQGVGLISTHDLELVHLADEFPAIHNYHFRDEVRDGRMVFDYKLRPGPCPTTNALKIMAQEGLPVGEI